MRDLSDPGFTCSLFYISWSIGDTVTTLEIVAR